MDIKGKKIAFLGDSITFGVGASSPDKVYWQLIAERTGAVCKGYGISGTRIAKQINPEPDGIHPNDAGYERMADRIIAFLENL